MSSSFEGAQYTTPALQEKLNIWTFQRPSPGTGKKERNPSRATYEVCVRVWVLMVSSAHVNTYHPCVFEGGCHRCGVHHTQHTNTQSTYTTTLHHTQHIHHNLHKLDNTLHTSHNMQPHTTSFLSLFHLHPANTTPHSTTYTNTTPHHTAPHIPHNKRGRARGTKN